jgi:hypothetical protein
MRRAVVMLVLLACDEDAVIDTPGLEAGADAHAADATVDHVETSTDASHETASDVAAEDAPWIDASIPPGIEGALAMWIEVDAQSIYWVGEYKDAFAPPRLWSVPIGGGTPVVLADLAIDAGDFGQVFSLAQDDTDLFFFGTHGSQTGSAITVNRVSKTGGAIAVLAQFTLLPFAIDLQTDGTDLFWLTDDGIVHRTPVSGGTTTTLYSNALASLGGRQLVLDKPNHRLFVPTTSGLVAVDTTTSAVTTVTSELMGLQLALIPNGVVFPDPSTNTFWRVSGASAVDLGIATHMSIQGVASDGTTVYWFHDGVGAQPPDGTLSAAKLEDGGVETVIAGGLESVENYGDAVAIDATNVYFSGFVVPDGGTFIPYLFVVPR